MMKLPHRSLNVRIVSIIIVLIVLTLLVSVFPVSAVQSEDRDNAAISLYKALSKALASRGTATTEYVYMTGTGDSMYPTINTGDKVMVQFYTNGYSINVGDIIVYSSWMIGMPINCMWIGHRVIEKYKEGGTWYFKTKGDNCPKADGWEVPERAVLGKIISIEHTERSTVPTKTASDVERATYPTISLPQGSEPILLITGIFCLVAILVLFDNIHRRQKNILKRANVCSCYSCRHYLPAYVYSLSHRVPQGPIYKGSCLRERKHILDGFSERKCYYFKRREVEKKEATRVGLHPDP